MMNLGWLMIHMPSGYGFVRAASLDKWPLTKSNVVAKELKLIGEGSLAQVLDNARRELGEATDPSSGRPQWGDPEEEWSDRHELTEKR
ncbi:hypothetical protein [Mesorhizobium sp. M0771]|uniref:hypothetical protein n=1 Tax=Mesorhizobium sp. M0771 TaxID=2956997 RepID=UPI00333CD906